MQGRAMIANPIHSRRVALAGTAVVDMAVRQQGVIPFDERERRFSTKTRTNTARNGTDRLSE
jgi:hypothetical protein